MQAEVLLTRPHARGAWLALAGGAGAGRILVEVPRSAAASTTATPHITSGILNVRAGLLAGYRFNPHIGLTLAVTLHYMLPSPLMVIDQTLGLEVRM
jgi:hypothetical protein